MSLIKKAKRSQTYLKLGLVGPSGSGKTYSSILIAKGFMGNLEKVCVLDTENGSANLYSHLGDYSVFPFAPPFAPDRYIAAINIMIKEGFEFIIMDSISHEWEGQGGCLDMHQKLGGRFQDWATVTPKHQAFIEAIKQAQVHILCTTRTKQEYAIENENGKNVVKKLGTKEIQRDGLEYELTTVLSVNMAHKALASKDRTGIFNTDIPFDINEEIGERLKKWSLGDVN